MQGMDGNSAALCNDAVLLAEYEEQVKRGLKVLEVWRKEWAVVVNVEKGGVMHMRRGIKRTGETFVNDERIEVVEKYKYLRCKMTNLFAQGWWRKG